MSAEKAVTITTRARSFSAEQRATLNRLMDLMIPASTDGRMPAASSLGLFDDPGWLAAEARATLDRGLDSLAQSARAQHDTPFDALPTPQAMAMVEAMRKSDRAFIGAFTLQTTARYLQQDAVMIELGLEPRPNWPQGYEVPEGDWDLLEPVRARGEIWRKV
ncbi:MAG: gluconate 2-dehydrogenase subunit 3 family protein [Burkholderiaceae bacterium]